MKPVQQEIPQLWKHLLMGYRVSSWPATLVWFILNFQNFCHSGLALCTALERYKYSGVLFCLDLFQNTLSLHHIIWVSRYAAHLHMLWLVKMAVQKGLSKAPKQSLHGVRGGRSLSCLGPFLCLFSEQLLLNFKIKIMLRKRAFFHSSFKWKCKKQKGEHKQLGLNKIYIQKNYLWMYLSHLKNTTS